MKISSKMFKCLALAGAIVMSAAYASDKETMCSQTCAQAARNASDQAKQSIAQQMNQSCAEIADPAGKSQCYAAVPTVVNQQGQEVYTSVYNSCMGSCLR
jgi:hypothetical protein